MWTFLILSGLLFSVEAGFFNLIINEVTVGLINSNNETSINDYCGVIKNLTCIENVSFCINENCKSVNLTTAGDLQFFIYTDSIKISSNLSFLDGVKKQFHWSKSITTNEKNIEHKEQEYFVRFNVAITCQNDYMGPLCSKIDLCKKLPRGICQNGGQCTQDNSTVECNCTDSYTGYYCQKFKNPCEKNLCMNNSTCEPDSNSSSRYHCNCPEGFTGPYCNVDIDECLNSSICSNDLNATCINTYGKYVCVCKKTCESAFQSDNNTASDSSYMNKIYNIKWPLSDFPTVLLVTLEGTLIVVLILVIIFIHIKHSPIKKKKSKFIVDDKYLFIKPKKSKKEKIEFAPNYVRPPIIIEENSQGSIPMFEGHDLDNSFNNILSENNAGMSTFGRR